MSPSSRPWASARLASPLLAASAGQRPREVLGSRGVRVILTEDNIEGTVDVLYGGGKKMKCKQ